MWFHDSVGSEPSRKPDDTSEIAHGLPDRDRMDDPTAGKPTWDSSINPEREGSAADSVGRTRDSTSRPLVGADTLLPPRPPLAKRLNRNALTVAAVVAGVTVLVAVVLVEPSKPSGPTASADATKSAAPLPARPSFLDQPPKVAPPPTQDTTPGAVRNRPSPGAPASAEARQVPDVHGNASGSPTSIAAGMTTGAVASPAQATAPTDGLSFGQEPSVDALGLPDQGVVPALPGGGAARSQGASGVSARHAAYEAALVSPVLLREAVSPPAAGASAPPPTIPTLPQPTFVATGTSPTGPALPPPGVAASATPSPVDTHTSRDTGQDVSPLGGVAHLEPAGEPLTLRAGTVIAGLLLTGLNSDLPGQVLGQTSRDVFDSRTERTLVIPKGSRLVGTYDSRSVASGRLVVTWLRLILPDGRSLTLPGLPVEDETGETGLHDGVNHHYARIYGNALLLSILGAGLQLSQPQQASAFTAPSPGQIAAGAAGQQFAGVATESVRRGMDIPPTITIRAGSPFNVFLTGDIAFAAPYTPDQ